MTDKNAVVDLDALVPPSVTIKFGGEDIEVKPPRTADVLKLGALGQKLQDVGKLSADEVDSLISELTAQIYACIPELNSKPLNTAQLLKLSQIISDMAVPPDVKELDAKGVTPGDPKPTA